jgi:hypothetical protein
MTETHRTRRRSGVPLAIALLALVVAVGTGTAVAGSVLVSSPDQIERLTIINRHIDEGTLASSDLNDDVDIRLRDDVFMGRVSAGGTLDTSRSLLPAGSSVARVTGPGQIAYCFQLPFVPDQVQVTADGSGSGDASAFASPGANTAEGCPQGTELSVGFSKWGPQDGGGSDGAGLFTVDRASRGFHVLIIR